MTGAACPMCGSTEWDGPRYVEYQTGAPRNWPTVNQLPLVAALQFACSLCGYRKFQPTVADGGPVIITSINVPKDVPQDNLGNLMNTGD